MITVSEFIYDDWRSFKAEIIQELFGDRSFYRGRYIFRGQSNSDWCLQPSFDRIFKDLSTNDKNNAVQELLLIFKQECEGVDIPYDVWGDEIKSFALGQHYGLPTRLLDWSESPYIAAFFAFNDAVLTSPDSEYVAIWAINSTETNVWNKSSGVQIVNVPSIGNIRLRNQYGKFTLSNTPFNCLEDYANHFAGSSNLLFKFLVKSNSALDAMADLDAMGINHTRMYPDLTGSALSAKVRVMLKTTCTV